jgi:hypothetical protein
VATIGDAQPTLIALYDWTLRCEAELEELKSAFPEVLRADKNRLVMSFSCLRVSLELRVKAPGAKRSVTASSGPGPQDVPAGRPY